MVQYSITRGQEKIRQLHRHIIISDSRSKRRKEKKMKEIPINFTASITKKGDLYEVKVKSGDIESIMPARSQEEAVGVAISTAGGFAQFLLSQAI